MDKKPEMKRISFFRGDAFPGIVAAFAAFVVYLFTLAPSVSWEDGGEIATSLYTLGIVHPTGYPLLTLIGWAFSHLPIGGRVIWRLNVLMALLCALSVFFFYRTFLYLLVENARKALSRRVSQPKAKGQRLASAMQSFDAVSLRLAAASASLALAFSRTFWSEALAVEVHSLHLFLLSVVTYLFVRAVTERATPSGDRLWYLFALFLGLSFSNHMMTVLLGPALLYLYFEAHGFRREAWIKIGKGIPVFLLGLSPYLYMPLRAAQTPFMNWGNTTTPARFWQHISGEQYRYRMFSSWEVPLMKVQVFFANLPGEVGYLPLVFWALGLWVLYRENRKFLAFILLLFFGCLLYGINYDFDDPNYFLNAYFAGAALSAFGVRWLIGRMDGRWIPAAIVVALPLVPLALNLQAVNKHGDYAAEDFARNTLDALEPGTIFLSQDEKFFLLPALYLQTVERYRTDIIVLNEPLMQHPWYLKSMGKAHPEIFANARAEVDNFIRADSIVRLYPDDDGSPEFKRDRSEYYRTFQALVESLFWKNYPKHPIAVAQGIELSPTAKAVPVGLSFRLFDVHDSVPVIPPPRDFRIRPFVGEDGHVRDVRLEYCRAYTNQGIYRIVFAADTAGGIRLLQKAVQLEPGFPAANQWLAQLRGF